MVKLDASIFNANNIKAQLFSAFQHSFSSTVKAK